MSEYITHRYDFVYLFDVTDGNPNGDPDAGNLPRTDPVTGQGLVTDVCLKRKIRNYVQTTRNESPGHSIYITEGAILNDQHRKAYQALGLDKENSKKLKANSDEEALELTRWMCRTFFDVRTFGALMTTNINCGQVRGPVQLGMARSLDPIFPQELAITRMAATNAANKPIQNESDEGPSVRKDNKTMGRKSIVPYGLYQVHGFVSAPMAAYTGFSADDLALLWEALQMMFEDDRSAARGEMSPRGLYVFQHQSQYGNAIARTLFDRIAIQRTTEGPIRSFADYRVIVDQENLPQGISLQKYL